MNNFTFHRPGTVAEAIALLQQSDDGKALSGGMSYVPVMKEGLAQPSDVVSLRGVEEIQGIKEEGGRLVIGAGQTHASVARSLVVQKAIPSLAALANNIGDAQVRNRGTIGGSLAHADPAADYPAAVLALDGIIHTDRRDIPATAFFTGLFQTVLLPDEIIVRVSFAVPQKANYQKFPHPASKYAVVGVYVAQHGDGVRVGVTGAAQNAARWPAAEQALSGNFSGDALSGLTVPTAALTDDPDFSAAYRAHLMGVLAERAVAAA